MPIKLQGPYTTVDRDVFYERARSPEGERVTIYAAREASLADCLTQCTLESFGGRQDSLDRARANLERARKQGAIGSIYHHEIDTYLIVRWPNGSEPRIELPNVMRDLHNAYKLLCAIERRMVGLRGASPDTWIKALAKMRARQVWTLRNPDYGFELCTLRRGLDAPLEIAPVEYSLTS